MKGKVTQSVLLVVMVLLVSAFIGHKSACEVHAQSCVQPPAGLISWWTGDGDPTDFQEINDGTLQNGASFATGKVDQAFSFDGVDDFVEVPDNGSLDLNGDFTIDAWVNPDSFTGTAPPPIVNKYSFANGNWATSAYQLSLLFNGQVRFGITCGLTWGYEMYQDTTTAVVPIGTWTHITAVYRQSIPSMEVYVNGVLQPATTTGSCTFINQNDQPIRIGHRIDWIGPNYFDGLIDEVEIFDRALSAGEIQAIFNADSAGKCKTIQVVVDIKPDSDPNNNNLKSNGVIPVAILTTDDFDATSVDPLTVALGPDGAPESHGQGHIEDVDADGDLDLILHFRTQETGIQCGHTSATLTGETYSGEPIEGSDSINVVKC